MTRGRVLSNEERGKKLRKTCKKSGRGAKILTEPEELNVFMPVGGNLSLSDQDQRKISTLSLNYTSPR